MSAHAGVADESAPMRESVGGWHGPGRQVLAQTDPRFHFRREASGQSRDMEQDRFASFLDGQTAQADGVHAR